MELKALPSVDFKDDWLVYDKSEADKVIAEKDAEIVELKVYIGPAPDEKGLVDYYLKSEADKVIAHHKYKRCMAKAEACMHKRWRTDEGFDYARSTRHMNKWLELAEKFKEAK